MENIISGSIHTHSEMSQFDGANTPKDLVNKFSEMGAKYFALTDHGTMTGIFSAWDVCEKIGMKFIPGVEAYVESTKGAKYYHLILLAKSRKGYKGLCKIVSESEKNYVNSRPCMTREMFAKYFGKDSEFHNEVICTSACIQGEVPISFLKNEYINENIRKLEEQTKKAINPNDPNYTLAKEKTKELEDDISKLRENKDALEKIKPVGAKRWNAVRKQLISEGFSEELLKKAFESNDINAVNNNEFSLLIADKISYEKAEKELKVVKDELKKKSKENTLVNKEVKDFEGKFTKYYSLKEQIDTLEKSKVSEEAMLEEAKEAALWYADVFGRENFFLELQYHGMLEEEICMPKVAKLARELGIKLVASNDIHMATKEDLKKRLLIKAKRFNTWSEAETADYELYIKSDVELGEMLSKILPEDVVMEALSNIANIGDICNVVREKETHYPEAKLEAGVDPSEEIERLCRESIPKLFPNGWTKEYEDRLVYELGVIRKMGFVAYHLNERIFVHIGRVLGNIPTEMLDEAPETLDELEKWCEEKGYDTGFGVGPGRGSAAGSMVCYLLGITSLDPIKYGLLFERFLNIERVSMPDIDTDFEPSVRKKLVRMVQKMFGEEYVAGIVTRNTQAARGSIRNTARFLGSEKKNEPKAFLALGDAIAKVIPNKPGIKIDDCIKDLYDKFGDNKDAVEIIHNARLVEGTFTNYGIHPAGIIISDNETIDNHMPLMHDDAIQKVQADMIVSEKRGLLKMDFLVLANLTYIGNCLRMLKSKGIKIDAYNLPTDDARVLKNIYANGNTTAVFQFESAGMKGMLKKFKPDRFEDLILLNAAYRPGPMDDLPKIIETKHSGKLTYSIPELEPILSPTYASVIYQEQVMQIFQNLANYSLGGADLVRRAMSKKHLDELEIEREAFLHGDAKRGIKGCEANGIDVNAANELFDRLLEFAKYAFNKSHAAVYSYVSYVTAYLKEYYPLEFLTSIMNEVPLKRIPSLIKEAERYGIKVLPPDVNTGNEKFEAVSDNEIRFGLGTIKTVGLAAKQIADARKDGQFTSVKDFLYRTGVDKGTFAALIKAGALDSFTHSRKALSSIVDELIVCVNSIKKKEKNIATLEEKFENEQEDKEKLIKKLNVEKINLDNLKMELNSIYMDIDLIDDPEERLVEEHEYLGTFVSGHILSGFLPEGTPIEDLEVGNSVITGVVQNLKIVQSKKTKKELAFFDIEDRSGFVTCVAFNKSFEQIRELLTENAVLTLKGRVDIEVSDSDEEEEEETLQFIVESVKPARKKQDKLCLYIRNIEEWVEIRDKVKECIQEDGHSLVIYDQQLEEFREFKTDFKVSDKIFEVGTVSKF